MSTPILGSDCTTRKAGGGGFKTYGAAPPHLSTDSPINGGGPCSIVIPAPVTNTSMISGGGGHYLPQHASPSMNNQLHNRLTGQHSQAHHTVQMERSGGGGNNNEEDNSSTGGGGGGGGGGGASQFGCKNPNKLFGVSPSDIDKYSRVVFPVCFVCFNLMYWIIYLHISAHTTEDLVLAT